MTVPWDIPDQRRPEYEALVELLMAHAAPGDTDARRVAEWVSHSALGDDHLYRDMGFADRAEVRALLEAHFPDLAAGNTKDMRWKKYFYKRLCGWPGFET